MTEAQWRTLFLACRVQQIATVRWAKIFYEFFQRHEFSAGFKREAPDFLSQVLHESQRLERLEENLFYSAERLCAVWPSRFPTIDAARRCARNPELLANEVYDGRMGNVNPGDGWRYRGGGLIMLTGYRNYAQVQKLTNLPLLAKPELLRQPGEPALLAAFRWWEFNVPDSILGNAEKVRRVVNGGLIGLSDTETLATVIRKYI